MVVRKEKSKTVEDVEESESGKVWETTASQPGPFTPSPPLPPEILDIIFGYVESITSSITLHRFLPAMLLVCKAWYEVGAWRLYSTLSLGELWTMRPLEDGGDKRCEALLRVMQNNPRLALRVKHLRLGLCNQHAEDLVRHARLIRLCKDVEHLEIVGYGAHRWNELKDAVKDVDPVQVTFSQISAPSSKILSTIAHWSRLREVELYNISDDNFREDVSPTIPLHLKGCCPFLREVKIRFQEYSGAIHPNYVLHLSELAPNVEVLSFDSRTVNSRIVEVIRTCLVRWSPTLTQLFLLGRSVVTSIDDICPELRNLQSLSVSSSAIRPSSLINLKNLEFLYYCSTRLDNKQLVGSLKNEEFLPSLKALTVVPASSIPASDKKSYRDCALTMHDICKDRRIDFPSYCFDSVV
ncbi:hypothetical protein SCHPADRAFT_902222 [Schizopora paradoxa]|uniref:F-box domain-containing protein n=1 Tax=Schizopora paradoxa TaxID=27342 RepID=A0A0H2RVF0_9AGAM|nr:hypothetical protein SCHPADRAFT_902222 [Schizopora paradoxa]